ncbi:hypothetical protein M408DRAFT_48689, partial [Serendipita vermifera MAFF 305830]
RTIWSVVWSCLSTIFLCTWVAIHPNVAFRPEKRNASWFETWIRDPLHDFFTYKLVLFFWALLVPEYILAWSVRQYIRAGQIQKQVPGWTRTHGFFMIMGGFHLFRLPPDAPCIPLPLKSSSPSDFVIPSGYHSREEEVPVCPLEMSDLPVDVLEFITPTKAELKDKGKSDGLTKLIILVQTSWFIIQCIARGTQGLPLTELEVITLAYAMLNFFIYMFWWDKPRNVECPIRVYKPLASSHDSEKPKRKWSESWLILLGERIAMYAVGNQDDYVHSKDSSSIPTFWSGRLDSVADATVGPSILGAAFGAIHCISWLSEFPSSAELIIWRVSCITMIAVPVAAFLLCSAGSLSHRIKGRDPLWLDITLITSGISLILSAWLYIAARIVTLVIAFTTLRALPSAAYSAVNWTTFIPHI